MKKLNNTKNIPESKFEKWHNKNFFGRENDEIKSHRKECWDACKKEILKELKGFEGEYVCDIIDRIEKI